MVSYEFCSTIIECDNLPITMHNVKAMMKGLKLNLKILTTFPPIELYVNEVIHLLANCLKNVNFKVDDYIMMTNDNAGSLSHDLIPSSKYG